MLALMAATISIPGMRRFIDSLRNSIKILVYVKQDSHDKPAGYFAKIGSVEVYSPTKQKDRKSKLFLSFFTTALVQLIPSSTCRIQSGESTCGNAVLPASSIPGK